MTVALLIEIGKVVFSPFKNPEQTKIAGNVIRLTGRITLGTGSAALILAIVNHCLKKQEPGLALPSRLLTDSLLIAATSAAIFTFCIYRCVAEKSSTNERDLKINRDAVRFEKTILYTAFLGSAAPYALPFLTENKAVRSVRSIVPISCIIGLTAAVIQLFHENQLKRARIDH